MSDISVEQKLELLQSIRETEDRNRMNLRQQENLLYGADRRYDGGLAYGEANENTKGNFFMGLRIFAAVVLFSLYVIFHFTEGRIFSVDIKTVDRLIGINYRSDSIDNIADFLYNK